MESKQLEIISDVQFVIERPSNLEEEGMYKRRHVIDSVSLNDLQTLDSKQPYELIAGVPKDISIKEGPVKNINDLTHGIKKPDEASLALFDEIMNLISNTYRVQYRTQDNQEKYTSLLPAIERAWSQDLYEYGNIEVEDNEIYVNRGGSWIVISALGKIISEEKLSDAFVKLHKEGEVKWNEDSKLRPKTQSLAYRGLATYVPEWGNIRWVLKKFSSFKEFHETISDLINKYRLEYEAKGQPSLILEAAYNVLEKTKLDYPEKFYQTNIKD